MSTSKNDSADKARRHAKAMYDRDTASRQLGIDIEVSEAGRATACMKVDGSKVNGLGVCHGGFIFALADSAFAFACNGYGPVTFAAAASIEFLRPAQLGDALTAEASERHRGRRSGLYDVVVTDQHGQLVALFRGRSQAAGSPAAPPAQP